MKVKFQKILILYIILFGYTLSSCTNEGEVSPKVFHYNQHNPLTSLDPAFAKSQSNIWPISHLYNTLITLDDSLNIVPDIAQSWNISDDGIIYTFILREDIYFHEDECFEEPRLLIAEDVAYSFNRLIDKKINSPGSWLFKGRVRELNPFEARSDREFIIHLDKPFAPFLSLLTMQYCSIVPHEAVSHYGAQFFENPVGSGPFKLRKWLDRSGLFLEVNDRYFKNVDHNLDGVRTSFIPDRSIALLEIINGNLDYMSGLESSYVNTALDKSGAMREGLKDRISLITNAYLNFEYLGINQDLALSGSSVLSYKEGRQALNYAIDRELMLNSLRNGIGLSADSGVIPRGLPSYDSERVKGFEYNQDKAKFLLSRLPDEALNYPLVISTSKDYLDLTTYIARQWEELGLDVDIDVRESAVLRDQMRSSAVVLFRASWIADYPDGENFLSLFYSKNPAPPNYTRYTNLEYDRLYEKSIGPVSKEERMELYHQMNQMIVDDAPVIFLFYDETANFYSNRVNGMTGNAINQLKLDELILTDQ